MVHTMEESLRGLVKVRSHWTWRGMSGAPTSFSRAMNSWLEEAEKCEDLSLEIWAFMRALRFCHRLETLLPILVHMSSGIGTSNTVSNPSALSKFGHSFLIERGTKSKNKDTKTKHTMRFVIIIVVQVGFGVFLGWFIVAWRSKLKWFCKIGFGVCDCVCVMCMNVC